MASEIRANTLKNRVGLGTVSFTNTGPVVSGIITATGADINGDIDVDGHTNLDNVSISGITTASTINSTGNIEIDVDNGEFRCGAGGDFKISHNGSLNILRSDFPTVFRNGANNQTLALFTPNGAVNLYHSNGLKFSTTSSGISIDGNISATGNLTPGGTLYLSDAIEHTDDSNTKIRFPAADTITAETGGSERLRIDSSGRVLIGTTSANQNNKIIARLSDASLSNTSSASVILAENNGNTWITIGSAASNYGGILFADSDSADIGQIRYLHGDNRMEFIVNTSERVRITSGGKVNIGGDFGASTYGLQVWGSGGTNSATLGIKNNVAGPAGIHLLSGHGNWSIFNSWSVGDALEFRDEGAGSTRMLITSDGKLLVGATSQTNGSIAEFSKSVGGGGAGCHVTVENTSNNSVNNTAGIHLKTSTGIAKFFKYQANQTFLQSASGGASELLLQASGAHPMRLYAGDAERVRIHDTGEVHFYGNQTSTPEGDFGFRWDRNTAVNFQLTNTNNTSVNASSRITLKTNAGTIAGTYYNNGGFYLINSANGYFNYYSNSILRVNINTNGDVYLNPDDANGIPTSNGNVGRRFGIKSTLNNIIIGETTNSGNFGLILESRVTGRTGNARSSQIGLGNGVIDFYTAAPSAGVTKRMEIASDGEIKCVGAADNKGFGVYISSTQRVAELIEHSADGEMRLYTGNATPLLKTVITSYGSSYINAAGTCRFGVGTSSPSARMHLYDTGTANSNGFRFETGTSGQTAKFVIKTTDNGDESKYLRLNGHWTEVGVHNNEGFRIRNSSNNIAMYMNAGGSYAFSGTNLSDRNLKEDIETISTPTIDLIKQVSPKLFKWKNDTSKTQHGGFIAQEMQPLFPRLISGTDYDESRTDHGDPNEEQGSGNPTGLAFDYDGYTAYLTKAMQELIAKVESLEAEVASLKG